MKIRILLATAAVALGLIAAPAINQSISSAPVAATKADGELVWAGRKNLTSYVGGPENVTVSDGAYKLPPTQDDFSWAFLSTDYNPATKTGSINYKGKVDWYHAGHGFHIIISNPTIKYTNGKGEFIADVKMPVTGGETTEGRAAIFTLSDSAGTVEGNKYSWPSVGTTVTAEGERLFQKWYAAGSAWDSAKYYVSL
ncbi:hypothetical protein D5S17_11990 [Pseudonocardiaceae bacterium YIM PH 21723]|nr:hypothetical protein D5S17_11990 [Pseudonocardiaceae bacterium YIM PH 21723]